MESKPIIDHGEPAGSQRDALAVDPGYVFALAGRRMSKAGFGGKAAGGSLQFTLTQRVDETGGIENAVALATCESLRDKMVSPPRHSISDFNAEPAGRRGRIARYKFAVEPGGARRGDLRFERQV